MITENCKGKTLKSQKLKIWVSEGTSKNGYLAIPEKFEKLITSLRTAQANEYSLDKDNT
jgi:hypothetical protein